MKLLLSGVVATALAISGYVGFAIGKNDRRGHRAPSDLSEWVTPNEYVIQKFVAQTIDQTEPHGYIFNPDMASRFAGILDNADVRVNIDDLSWRYDEDTEMLSLHGKTKKGIIFEIEAKDSYSLRSFRILR